MMKKWLPLVTVSAACLSFSSLAAAEDLVEVFNQALSSDPTYKAAQAEQLSQHENVPISRAFLLPSLNASANRLKNWADNKSTGALTSTGLNAGLADPTYDFISHGYDITLSQPIFDLQAWANLGEAKAGVKAADATYASAAQSLISRTSTAYFNILQAEDDLRYTEAEKRSTYRQLDQVRQQFKVGLVPITGVYQAQAEYDNIIATEIAAKNAIINTREDLREITGVYYTHLAGLRSEVPLVTPEPENVDKWVDTATKQNWSLQAARWTAEAAKDEINVQRSGHLPTVDAVAGFDRNKTSRTPVGTTNSRVGSVGVQLALPVFEGGLVMAETKQAEYDYQGALDQREITYRAVVTNSRQSYNNIVAGISKVKADRQAIVSNEASLRSTIEGYKVGTQTMLDVLEAQRNLYDTQRQYSRDQYDYIKATIALKEAAGTLSLNDIREINAWLTKNRPSYKDITVDSLKDSKPAGHMELSGEITGGTDEEINQLEESEKKATGAAGSKSPSTKAPSTTPANKPTSSTPSPGVKATPAKAKTTAANTSHKATASEAPASKTANKTTPPTTASAPSATDTTKSATAPADKAKLPSMTKPTGDQLSANRLPKPFA